MFRFLRGLAACAAFLAAATVGFLVVAEQLSEPTYVIAQATPAPSPGPVKKAADKTDKKGPETRPAAAPTPPPAAPPQALAVPQPEVLLIMVRTALIALDHANKTNNYAVIHALGGPMLRQNSPERLSEMFSGVRSSGVDFQPVLVLTPELTQAPAISPQGLLTLVGHFPTQPLQIRFQIGYQPVGGVWRLAGLNVGLAPVATAAATPPATASAKAPAAKAQK